MKESGSVNTSRSDMLRRPTPRTTGVMKRAGQREQAFMVPVMPLTGTIFFVRSGGRGGVIHER